LVAMLWYPASPTNGNLLHFTTSGTRGMISFSEIPTGAGSGTVDMAIPDTQLERLRNQPEAQTLVAHDKDPNDHCDRHKDTRFVANFPDDMIEMRLWELFMEADAN
ncbi:hypothetical protein BGX31_003821, partial [Mortierella sp. GBA43]